MSGIVALRREDSVILLTDGAGTDSKDRLQWVGSKVLIMPELPALLAVRGPAQFLWALRTHWSCSVPTFDAMLGRLVEDATIVEQMHVLHRYPARQWEVVAAGWSGERQAWEVWDCYGGPIPDFAHPPYTLRKIEGPAAAWPNPAREQIEALGLHQPADPPLSPEVTAALVMVAMRNTMHPDPARPGHEYYGIGGFLQETILDHAGCSTRIVHRWADVIGEPITP